MGKSYFFRLICIFLLTFVWCQVLSPYSYGRVASNKVSSRKEKKKNKSLNNKNKKTNKGIAFKPSTLNKHKQFHQTMLDSKSGFWHGDIPSSNLIMALINFDDVDSEFKNHGYKITESEDYMADSEGFRKSYKKPGVCFIGMDGGSGSTSYFIDITDKFQSKFLYQGLRERLLKGRTLSPEYYKKNEEQIIMEDGRIIVNITHYKPWNDFNAITMASFFWDNIIDPDDGCIQCGIMDLQSFLELMSSCGFKMVSKNKKIRIEDQTLKKYVFRSDWEKMTISYYTDKDGIGVQINIKFDNSLYKDFFLANSENEMMRHGNMFFYQCCDETGVVMEIKGLEAVIYDMARDPALPL